MATRNNYRRRSRSKRTGHIEWAFGTKVTKFCALPMRFSVMNPGVRRKLRGMKRGFMQTDVLMSRKQEMRGYPQQDEADSH
ncbi:unnamed protein product [Nezara viridula]|uniref:Uncharacterized protein n=1 Tax=Nezara viridula TaxID=85310 RepID=A0A9P0H385_NEZVI|nr:unnamed protein product [Nezara viridula]